MRFGLYATRLESRESTENCRTMLFSHLLFSSVLAPCAAALRFLLRIPLYSSSVAVLFFVLLFAFTYEVI